MSRHEHLWREAGRIFTGRQYGVKVRGVTEELFREMAFGVTSIELRCECGVVKEARLLGDHARAEP